MENIPKKCQECIDRTTNRKRENVCSKMHKGLAGCTIAPCEHPFVLTDDEIAKRLKEAKREIAECEERIRRNKEVIRREEALIEMEKSAIREIGERSDPYRREANNREVAIRTKTECDGDTIRLTSITLHEKGKKRELVIMYSSGSARFGRAIIQDSPGHWEMRPVGIVKGDPYKNRPIFAMLEQTDRDITDRIHDAFEGWLLKKVGN